MVQKSLKRLEKIKKNIEFEGNLIYFKKLNKIHISEKKHFVTKNNFNSKYLTKFFINRFVLKKFINMLVKKGKKSKARNILKKTFINIKEITGKNPYIVLFTSLKKLKPYIETKKMRKAGRVEEIPVPLKKRRQSFLMFKWFFLSFRTNKLKTYNVFNLLTKEILDLNKNKGNALGYKKISINTAYRNRAIAHFRWC